jgi:pimeloyl-ACP methyl ester carboxylesterase
MKTPRFVQKGLARMLAKMMYQPSGAAHPSRKTVMRRLSKSMGMDLEQIYSEFHTDPFTIVNDGVEIPAEYHPVPEAKGVAILAHGFGQNRYALTPQAKIFHNMGYSTVMFDQRHFGVSKAPCCTFSVKEAGDLLALVHYIRKRCGADTRIVVLGVSMGAMAVMHAIGQSDEIDAAVEDCGPTDMERILEPFSMSISKEPNPYLRAIVSEISAKFGAPMEENRPVDGVARSNTPLLILQGEADSLVSVQHAKDIMEVTRNPLSRMKTFRGREHAYSIQDYDIYGQCLKEFLNDIFG